MNRPPLIILFILVYQFSFAQSYLNVGARSNSMANASVALVDGWAYHNNPGALGDLKKMEIGVSYENRFLLKDLQSQGLVYALPLRVGVVSFGSQLFGSDAYKSYRVGGGYSMRLTDKLFIGVQLNYQGFRLSSNYGSKNTITAEVGIFSKLTEKWNIGVSVFNLGRTKISSFQDERLNTLLRIGSTYQLSSKVLFAMEAEKNINYQLRFKSAFEYSPVKKIFLRAGIKTQPIAFTFGFGYKSKFVQLDFGSSYNQLLGWSPHISFTYKIGE